MAGTSPAMTAMMGKRRAEFAPLPDGQITSLVSFLQSSAFAENKSVLDSPKSLL
jgi:hypothetical protein